MDLEVAETRTNLHYNFIGHKESRKRSKLVQHTEYDCAKFRRLIYEHIAGRRIWHCVGDGWIHLYVRLRAVS